jgi:hypothetical protein
MAPGSPRRADHRCRAYYGRAGDLPLRRADNAPELVEPFDAVVGLFIDSSTMATRLDEVSRGSPFGRMGDSRRFVLDNLDSDQRLLASWVDAIVDAGRPLAQVGEDVCPRPHWNCCGRRPGPAAQTRPHSDPPRVGTVHPRRRMAVATACESAPPVTCRAVV